MNITERLENARDELGQRIGRTFYVRSSDGGWSLYASSITGPGHEMFVAGPMSQEQLAIWAEGASWGVMFPTPEVQS